MLFRSWQGETRFASDYFERMVDCAERLIRQGDAYVDSQSVEDLRAGRGDFSRPGTESPFRNRSVTDNLELFRRMRAGECADGSHVLRAKIDMAHPNMIMRDPLLYRIRHAHHHRSGDAWCIYPMYDFAHPLEDAFEGVTHSICTLEFESNRELYDWVLDRLGPWSPRPRQYEFARLALGFTLMSKRKLLQLVEEKQVSGWDDPRMPTLAGMRRRGYTPASIRKVADDSGASKSNIWLDYSVLDIALRADLENQAKRAMAVIDPVELKLTNYAEVFGSDAHREPCEAPFHPHHPEWGQRAFSLGPELWIEREDFAEVPPKGYKRLFPGNKVRLKGGYVIECTGAEKDADGNVTKVLATVVPDTKSGTPGADSVKVKAAITWVGMADGVAAEVRVYDRLFTDPHPDAGGKDFKASLNPDSFKVVTAYVEP